MKLKLLHKRCERYSVTSDVDDLYALINNAFFISSLMFAFAVSIMTTTLSREDMLAGDTAYARWMAFRFNGSRVMNGTTVPGRAYEGSEDDHLPILSANVMRDGADAIEWLMTCIVVSAFALVSLSLSNPRKNSFNQSLWAYGFLIWIIYAYVCLIMGILSFFQLNHSMIDMLFPLYPALSWPANKTSFDYVALQDSFYANDYAFVDLTRTPMVSGYLGVLQWQASDRKAAATSKFIYLAVGIFVTHGLCLLARWLLTLLTSCGAEGDNASEQAPPKDLDAPRITHNAAL